MKFKISDFSHLLDPGLHIHSGGLSGLTPISKETVERYVNSQFIEEFAEINEHAFLDLNCRCATSIHFDDSKNYFFNNLNTNNVNDEKLMIANRAKSNIETLEQKIIQVKRMSASDIFKEQGTSMGFGSSANEIDFNDFLPPVDTVKNVLIANLQDQLKKAKEKYAKL